MEKKQNYVTLQKGDWNQNSHLYRFLHDHNFITHIYIYKHGLDELVK